MRFSTAASQQSLSGYRGRPRQQSPHRRRVARVATRDAHVRAACAEQRPLSASAARKRSAARREHERRRAARLGQPARREQPQPARAAGEDLAPSSNNLAIRPFHRCCSQPRYPEATT